MIIVTPPLPVICGTQSGHLCAISPTHAQVSWSGGSFVGPFERITVQCGDGQSPTFSVVVEDSDLLRFDSSSLNDVQDFLHILRKSQHITLCATADVEHSQKDNGFSSFRLPVIALPESSWDSVSTETMLLNQKFGAPIIITGMTGGVAQASMINERLAQCAITHNIPMGVGSQRMALENPRLAPIFQLKDKFPGLFLIGNLGIGQLRSKDYLDLCRKAVAMIQADALAIHVNVLQELIQIEGDRDFRGIIDRIGQVQQCLQVPVIVKEVGGGLDSTSAKRLWDVGIRNFDIGGSGGTSWAHIEGLRASSDLIKRRGEIFRNWGLSTSEALEGVRKSLPDATIIATGGLRDGLTVLKALYKGADMAGIGLPLMRAALEGPDQPTILMGAIIEELKIAMMVSGTRWTSHSFPKI
jgi:isopentenyl-diphosphate delta-isomerase